MNNEKSSVFSALGSTSYISTNLGSFIVASTCVNASLLRFATVTFFLPNTYFCIPEGNFNECVVINLATLNLSKIEENYLQSLTNSCVGEKSNTTFRPQPFNNTLEGKLIGILSAFWLQHYVLSARDLKKMADT